ncbi:MAG TPA: Crp/Fnr family transcriptional regulator [Candidatus Dormibacteraeota bacterium]|nr:Crp/Fnr family transcriptional regulator [Candidatus Dormibacteraeota bacterium]
MQGRLSKRPISQLRLPPPFDVESFLRTLRSKTKVIEFSKKGSIFAQGDPAGAVFYIKKGRVKLTVISEHGKSAIIGVLNDGHFFGEGCMAGQALRIMAASAITDCTLLRIEKAAMMAALHERHDFSEFFIAYVLSRNVRYQADLVDQLFNSTEKRLARILLLLAHYGKEGQPERIVPKVSHETLAQMLGTTRPQVSHFMNKFRKLGFIEYSGRLKGSLEVHSSLLSMILHQ